MSFFFKKIIIDESKVSTMALDDDSCKIISWPDKSGQFPNKGSNICLFTCSVLICRQILLSEQVAVSSTDVESIISNCTERLLELLDHVQDVGIEGIVEIISGVSRW